MTNVATEASVHELIRRARLDDADAITELVRRYEPDIRRIARVRIARGSLRHLHDSQDISQSVFRTFFERLRSGGLLFESADKVLHLLVVMTANRVTSHARREYRQPRSAGSADGAILSGVADRRPQACEEFADQEELARLLDVLPQDVEYLWQQRLVGRSWADLGGELGATGEALRKRMERALARARERLEAVACPK